MEPKGPPGSRDANTSPRRRLVFHGSAWRSVVASRPLTDDQAVRGKTRVRRSPLCRLEMTPLELGAHR